MPKKTEKLRWMTDQEMIDQLAQMSGNSSFRDLPVKVTQDDCDQGEPGRPTKCAFARAVRRLMPTATFVCVRHDGVTVTIEKRYLHFQISHKASVFIEHYDRGEEVEPGAFVFHVGKIANVPQASDERKVQINAARKRRRDEGRPDKVYRPESGVPMRMRMSKDAEAA